jgi:putative endonuclease
MTYRIEIGQQAEQAACNYLQQKGLQLEDKNFSSKFGEIDLIMKDGEFLVFIEVRLRTNLNYATALESVTRQKQRKIIKTAQFYLQTQGLLDKVPCRFDVIAVTFSDVEIDFDWIKNAFY